MTRLLLLGVLLTACAEPRLVDVPATLWLDPELPAEHAEGALAARDWWLEQAPGVFVRTASSSAPTCGVYVRVGVPDDDLAQTHRDDSCLAVVTVARELPKGSAARVLMHEYGHAFLGGEHRGGLNVMGDRWATPTLDDDQREGLLARMQGGTR